MTNDLVDDNTGIIKNYKIDLSYIYVYYLDGHMERYDFSFDVLQEINNKMINQAHYMVKHNQSEKVIKQKNADKIKLGITAGTMFLTASIFYDKYLIDSGNFQPINLLIEGLGVCMLPFITIGYINFINRDREKNINKYKTYLDNYNSFIKCSSDEKLYEGIEYKGEISINTIDDYSHDDINRMCENLVRIRNRYNK